MLSKSLKPFWRVSNTRCGTYDEITAGCGEGGGDGWKNGNEDGGEQGAEHVR